MNIFYSTSWQIQHLWPTSDLDYIPNVSHIVINVLKCAMGDGATCIHLFAKDMLAGRLIAFVVVEPAATNMGVLKLPQHQDHGECRGSNGQHLHGKAGSQLWTQGGESEGEVPQLNTVCLIGFELGTGGQLWWKDDGYTHSVLC